MGMIIDTKLDKIFELQNDLQRRIFMERMGLNWDELSLEERCKWVKDNVHWVVEELHEMTRELPYMKHWKTYTETPMTMYDKFQNAKKEYADALHFFINIAILLGFNAEELFYEYMGKNAVNHHRQDGGY